MRGVGMGREPAFIGMCELPSPDLRLYSSISHRRHQYRNLLTNHLTLESATAALALHYGIKY